MGRETVAQQKILKFKVELQTWISRKLRRRHNRQGKIKAAAPNGNGNDEDCQDFHLGQFEPDLASIFEEKGEKERRFGSKLERIPEEDEAEIWLEI